MTVMRATRSVAIFLSLSALSVSAWAETVKGDLLGRDTGHKTIKVKVGDKERSFTYSDATKYLDGAGESQAIFGNSDFPLWSSSHMKVTIETKDGTFATSIQFPVKIMTKMGGGKLPPGAKVMTASGPGVTTLEGKPLPALSMTTMDGKAITSQSLKGKVVVIDFWATWCEPCKMLSPSIQAIHTKYSSKGVFVIGANTRENGDAKTNVAKYVKEHKYTYAMTLDNQPYSQKLGVTGIPCVLVVDKKGVVSRVFVGYGPGVGDQIDAAVAKLLK